MAAINADIKPTGINQRDLVDLIYMIVTSFRGIANKLDNDGGITDTDYRDNVDACLNLVLNDTKGNHLNLAKSATSTRPHTICISPTGFDWGRSSDLLYMLFDAWETLCEQIDADTNPPTSTNYEASFYTAMYLTQVESSKGNLLGIANAYTFRHGAYNQKMFVDALYGMVDGIESFCEQADTDAAPADNNYEALWFTNNITLTIENSAGSRVGN